MLCGGWDNSETSRLTMFDYVLYSILIFNLYFPRPLGQFKLFTCVDGSFVPGKESRPDASK